MNKLISSWHEVVKHNDAKLLKSILDKNAIFYSPILFKPQQGRNIVMSYLLSAAKMFEYANFQYVKEIVGEQDAMLEFHAEIDGIIINGVDIITWNRDDKIIEFKVMVRSGKAIEKVGEKMLENLREMSVWDKLKLKMP